MSLPSKKKSSKREDQRRLATYKVNNCKSSRLQISPTQLIAFVRHIEGNNCSQFGIVRLCSLELDNLYPNPNLPSEKSTLIRFAAKLGRDSIVAALIRGGADPTVFSCTCPESMSESNKLQIGTKETNCLGINGACPILSATIRRELSLIPSPLTVWIIKNMIRMRGQYLLKKETFSRQKKQEQFWQKNQNNIELNKLSTAIPTVGGLKTSEIRVASELLSVCELCSVDTCRRSSASSFMPQSPLIQQQQPQEQQKQQQSKFISRMVRPSLCVGECSLLVMEKCNHIICESCFLQHAVLWNHSGEDVIEEEEEEEEEEEGKEEVNEKEEKIMKENIEVARKAGIGGCGNDIKCPVCIFLRRNASIIEKKKNCSDDILPPLTAVLFNPICNTSRERSRRLFFTLPELLLPPYLKTETEILTETQIKTATDRGREIDRRALTEIDTVLDRNSNVDIECMMGRVKKSDEECKAVSTKKSKFRALPRESIAKIQMGTIRSQRCEELWRAAIRGRGFRLRALFEAGVDIDVTNEYGQSALFLAAANGHSRTVALLISMGAWQIKDNAGVFINFTAGNVREEDEGDERGTNGTEEEEDGMIREEERQKQEREQKQEYEVEQKEPEQKQKKRNEVRKVKGETKEDMRGEKGRGMKIIKYELMPFSVTDASQYLTSLSFISNINPIKSPCRPELTQIIPIKKTSEICLNRRESDDVERKISKVGYNMNDDQKNIRGNMIGNYLEKRAGSAKNNVEEECNKRIHVASEGKDRKIEVEGEMIRMNEKDVIGRIAKEGESRRRGEGESRRKGEEGEIRGEEEEEETDGKRDEEGEGRGERGRKTRNDDQSVWKDRSEDGERRIMITRLIPSNINHIGASSFYIDDAFSTSFLLHLDNLFLSLPTAPAERGAIECASRAYFCDVLGYVTNTIELALKYLKLSYSVSTIKIDSNIRVEVVEKYERFDNHEDVNSNEKDCFHDGSNCNDNGDSLKNNDNEDNNYNHNNNNNKNYNNDDDDDDDNDYYNENDTYNNDNISKFNDNGHVSIHNVLKDENLRTNNNALVTQVLPHMRFLKYSAIGACSPPHIDLSRKTADGRCSTHTFLLYLSDCKYGGETRLLKSVNTKNTKMKDKSEIMEIKNNKIEQITTSISTLSLNSLTRSNVLASVQPVRGRLLVFPHQCPHEGMMAESLPKILLRGEMI